MAKPRARWRRWLRRIGLGALGLVLVVVGALVLVIETGAGTRFAAEQALTRYSASIPGTIEFTAIEGALGDEVCIEGLRLADAAEHDLVTVQHVCLELDLVPIMRRSLQVESLRAEGTVVHLWPDANWGDLAAPKEDEPPKPLPGPDLGLEIGATLEVDRFTLVRHGEHGDERLVENGGLRGALRAGGREATALVDDVWGYVAPAKILIASGNTQIEWRSPEVSVIGLTAVSSSGVVEQLDARLHVLDKRYEATITAVAFPPGDAPLSLAMIDLDAHGTWQSAGAGLVVTAPEYGTVDLQAMLGFDDESRRATLVGELRPTLRGRDPRVRFVASAALAGERRTAYAIASVRNTVVAAAWRDDDAVAFASLPGTSVDAAVRLRDNAVASARAELNVGSAAQTVAELRRLLPMPLPDIEGSGHVDAACTHGTGWNCLVEATVRQHEDWLAARAAIAASSGTVRVDLERFVGRARGQRVRLVGTAHARIEGETATIADVQLLAAGGRVSADGTIAWADHGRSDLRVGLHGVDLDTVQRFAPKVPVSGRVTGDIHLAGTAARPELDASVTGTELAWDERALGRVQIDARYRHGSARAEVAWKHHESGATVRAAVPLVASLAAKQKVRLQKKRGVVVSVDVDAFDLRELEPWIGEKQVAGRIDATVHAAGTLRDPTVVASVTGAHLQHRGRDLGNAAIELAYADHVAEVHLRVGGLARATAAARVPIAIDLDEGSVQHDPKAEHRLAVLVERLDLQELEPWIGRRVDGIVGGEIEVVSERGDAKADVILVARDLVVEKQQLGAAEVKVHADHEGTKLDVQVSGTQARLVELQAALPLALRGVAKPEWRRDAPLVASVELDDVELSAVTSIARAEPMGGEVDGALLVSGTASDPKLHASLAIDDLASRGEPLGWVRVTSTYDDGQVVAEVEQRNGVQQLLVSGHVPVTIDLAQPKFAWHSDRHHHVSVHALGVDEHVVGTFAELPSGLAFRVAAAVDAHGTLDDPRLRVRLRGDARSGDDPSVPVSLLAAIGPTEQRARLMVGGRGPTGLVVDAKTDAPLPALIAGEADLGAVTVEIEANAEDFDLKELSPLLPHAVYDPRGKLQLTASMKGPVGAPVLSGSVSMRDGSFTLVPLNQRFTDVDLQARFTGPEVELERFTARSGKGSASLTAKLHVAPQATKGEARFIARKLPIVRPGFPMSTASAVVDMDLDATGALTKIALEVRKGFIDVVETKTSDAAAQIPPDDGVTYTDPKGERARAKQAAQQRTPWLPRDIELSVKLVDPVRLRGVQADMDWTGQVEVVRTAGAKAKADGRLGTERGRVSLMSNDFTIVSGRITLPPEGDLDPYIDLVATTDTEEALVTMTIRGRVSRPTLRLSSEPPMSESDIFALLLTGHADATEAQEGDFSAKAASLLAAFENPALQRQLRQTVGVDRVGVGFGETVEEPIVTVGKRLTRKVYVEAAYHHNAPPTDNEAEVRLEYQFKPPRWSVETYFGDAAAGGVGLWWRRRFGGPKPEPKPEPPAKKRQANR